MYQDKDSGWLTIGPLPAAGILRQTLEEMGATFKFVWGMPGEKALESQIVPFARAAHCARRLSISRVGLLGYASMGMYTGTIDHIRLRHDIGPEIDHLDQYAIVKKVEEIRDDQISSLVEKAKAEWQLSEGVSDSALGQTMRFYLALKSLAEEREWNALTVKCQYELSRLYGFAPCVALSMLADEMTSSCEGDLPLLITQLIMHYLSGQPVSYGDVHLITEDSILLGACGFAPLKLGAGRPLIGHHTALYEGLLNQTNYREGKVTLARLASSKDGHFRMHIARGEGKTPRPYHEVGCPPYPSIEVKLDGSTKHFGQNLMSQHYSIGFKDLVEELKELCLILKIEPVLS
jgi:L-fucose isomerase-like protein